MARSVFYSFHFANDFWRTQQVRNMRSLEGNTLATPNRWEEIKRSGDAAIRAWIDSNIKGKSCLVVLVGSETAQRQWVRYEIKKAWEDGRGVLGVHIHGLKDNNGNITAKGNSPFADVVVTESGGTRASLGSVPPLRMPAGHTSNEVYANISSNIENWIEDAILARKRYDGAR